MSKKIFVMINKDGGGQFLDFVGGGDIELMATIDQQTSV